MIFRTNLCKNMILKHSAVLFYVCDQNMVHKPQTAQLYGVMICASVLSSRHSLHRISKMAAAAMSGHACEDGMRIPKRERKHGASEDRCPLKAS